MEDPFPTHNQATPVPGPFSVHSDVWKVSALWVHVRELGFLFLNTHEKSLEDWKSVLTRR